MRKFVCFKKSISALMVILLVSALSSSSFATTTNTKSVATNKKDSNTLNEKNKIHYIGTEKELEDYFIKKIIQHEEKFSVPIDRNKLSEEALNKVLNKLYENPEVMDVYKGMKLYFIIPGNKKYMYQIDVKYKISKKSQDEIQTYIKKWVKDHISESMTEEEKIRTIHDHMVRTYRYDYGDKNGKVNGYPAHTSGALIFGKGGVCQGYAVLFHRLATEVGLKTKLIKGFAYREGEGGGHAWNMVSIGGNWYHIDVTWDDPIGGDPSKVYYDHYLKSDDDMGQTHSWDRKKYPQAPYNYKIDPSIMEDNYEEYGETDFMSNTEISD